MRKKGFASHLLQSQKRNTASMPKKNAGFSIAELVVVLGIIALIALISLPLFVNYQKTTKLRSETRALAINLRLTQQLAVTEQSVYNLKLLPLTDSYQIINSKTSDIIKEIELDSEVSINEINGFTNNTVQFTPIGGALETGNIVLINTKNEISTIQIKPSGYVEIND